ncbi:hypothetical protein QE152_g286 [Popillia japonica]|uniref:Uncharacterized protein n=1 Tax=Popillia japonica TaxID=7064 RepID=A0AAW1NJY0_POPJA
MPQRIKDQPVLLISLQHTCIERYALDASSIKTLKTQQIVIFNYMICQLIDYLQTKHQQLFLFTLTTHLAFE